MIFIAVENLQLFHPRRAVKRNSRAEAGAVLRLETKASVLFPCTWRGTRKPIIRRGYRLDDESTGRASYRFPSIFVQSLVNYQLNNHF